MQTVNAAAQRQHARPVGAEDARLAGQGGDVLEHALFRLQIKRRRHLVEQQDRSIGQNGARNGQPLVLPLGQRAAAFAQRAVQPAGQAADEILGAGGAQRRCGLL